MNKSKKLMMVLGGGAVAVVAGIVLGGGAYYGWRIYRQAQAYEQVAAKAPAADEDRTKQETNTVGRDPEPQQAPRQTDISRKSIRDYDGTMAGFPITLHIDIDPATSDVKAIYRNVNYNATINMKGHLYTNGELSLQSADRGVSFSMSLRMDGNTGMRGTGYADGKELTVILNEI